MKLLNPVSFLNSVYDRDTVACNIVIVYIWWWWQHNDDINEW